MPIDPPIITIITGGSLIIIANLISYIKQWIKKKGEKNGETMFNNRDDIAFIEPDRGTFEYIIQLYNHSILFKTSAQLIFLIIMVLLLHDCRVL